VRVKLLGVVTYDDELRAHNDRLRAAAAIRRGEDVLDIGCGAGQTTREAARAAAPGWVLGVDVSGPALEQARELAAAEHLDNVTYEHGDAQVHRFEPERFDVAISRFGVMFFSDPVAAFANIARALRRRARVVLLVWQRRERNEWGPAIDDALGAPPPSATFDPFSLGDPGATQPLLEQAGFDAVRFEDVHEPMFFGADVEEALDWVGGFQHVRDALDALDPIAREQAIERLRTTLDSRHIAGRGVVFDSRAWLVTARRR
jgi:SAM-dependent methyltransferase